VTESNGSAITCEAVFKRFGAVRALDAFDLDVPDGKILSLLGPSGCGKTTALRVIAGFERPDRGSVTIGGRSVVDDRTMTPPEQRRVGMVFQDYALFPHLDVARNVAYGLDGRDPDRVQKVLTLVGLEDKARRMPHELSGGEQQRVALARALAPRPDAILLDEPFSNLDATLRVRMRRDVRRILNWARATTIFVTHDQEEALAMADVVAVMRAGTIVQAGTPKDLYQSPADKWVAGFIGESEFVDGDAGPGRVETPLGAFPHFGSLRGAVEVMVRPEWIHLEPAEEGTATVVDQEFYGHDQLVLIEFADGRRLRARVSAGPVYAAGDRVQVGVDEVVVFPKGS
jgi:iron(III) transport system ATP-binding protein